MYFVYLVSIEFIEENCEIILLKIVIVQFSVKPFVFP